MTLCVARRDTGVMHDKAQCLANHFRVVPELTSFCGTFVRYAMNDPPARCCHVYPSDRIEPRRTHQCGMLIGTVIAVWIRVQRKMPVVLSLRIGRRTVP